MLPEVNTSWPARWNGRASSSRMRSALRIACSHVDQPLEQEAELVAPQPRHGVDDAHRRAQAVGERHQQLVADAVAEAVVDHLEAVEVEEEHREAGARAAPAALQRHLQAVDEEGAVGQAGQRVVQGVVQQLALGLLAVADVGLRAGHAVGAAPLVAHRQAARQHPAEGTIAVTQPVLALEVRRAPLDVFADLVAQPSAVARVDAREPLLRVVAELALFEAEHRRPSGWSSRSRCARGPSPRARRWRRGRRGRSAPRCGAAPPRRACVRRCRGRARRRRAGGRRARPASRAP